MEHNEKIEEVFALTENSVNYYFKLCGNIADPIEVKFAQMEIEGLFPGKLQEIFNFVDVLIQPPLNQFISSNYRVQDIITRDMCYGRIKGFCSEYKLTDISDLVRRLAYTREIYVLVKNNESRTAKEFLQSLCPTATIGGDCQIFRLANDSFMLFRFVAHTYFFENMKAVVYFSFAKSKERMWERVRENVNRLIKHAMEGQFYIPLHPSARMYKEVEDLFDERKEVKLYLSHAFGPPYKAKFHPRMAKALMNYIGVKNGPLLDPFVGSGTTSIECTLAGIDSVGVDISPVCILATKAKVSSLEINPAILRQKIDYILRSIKVWEKGSVTQVTLDTVERYSAVEIPSKVKSRHVGKEEELLVIYRLKDLISKIRKDETLDEKTREDLYNIFTCALSKVISEALKAKTRKNLAQMFEDEIEEMYKIILAFDELRRRLNIKLGSSKNYIGDVRNMKMIPELKPMPDGNVYGIVTSPPYSTAVDYIRNDLPMLEIIHEANISQLERDMMGNPRFTDNEKTLLDEIQNEKGNFLELPAEAKAIINKLLNDGRKNLALRQYKFLIDMKTALQEMFRVLKPSSKCIIIIGNNHFRISDKVVEFKNAQYLYEMAPHVGFKPEEIIERTLLKTSYGAIQQEHILILKKENDVHEPNII
jgi:DNA modification methylase